MHPHATELAQAMHEGMRQVTQGDAAWEQLDSGRRRVLIDAADHALTGLEDQELHLSRVEDFGLLWEP